MQRLKNSFKNFTNRLSSHKQDERTALLDKSAKYQQYLEAVPNVLHYKDYELPSDLIHPKVLDDLQDFEIRESDILIVSYPQSGSSVVEELISQIVSKVNESQASRRGRWKCQVAKLEESNPFGHMRWLNGLKSPRILTSNLPLELLPQAISNGVCKIIYLIRNPKDQSISYFYHHRVKSIITSFDNFFDLFISGHLLYGDYFSHVTNFWQLYKKFPEQVFFVSFEEIKLETLSMAELLVKFLGYELAKEDLKQLPALQSKTSAEDKKRHFEGVIGDWMNYFKPEQSRQIDQMMISRFDTLGLSICCDPTEATKRLNSLGRIIIDRRIGVNQWKIESNNKKNVNEKLKMAKDEVALLRNKHLSKIEIVDSSDDIKKDSYCHCPNIFRFCCPCIYRTLDYTKV